MKRDIDIVAVTSSDESAKALRKRLNQTFPHLNLVCVLSISKALHIVETCKVHLLTLSPDTLDIDDFCSQWQTWRGKHVAKPLTQLSMLLSENNFTSLLPAMAALSRPEPDSVQTLRPTYVKMQEHIVLEGMKEAVISCDMQGKLTYMNNAAQKITGLTYACALGTPVTEIIEIDLGTANAAGSRFIDKLLSNAQLCLQSIDSQLIHKNGKKTHVINSVDLLYDNDGQNTGAVMVMREADSQYEEMHHQANYDWLTDLPNRALLTDRLNLAIQLSVRHHYLVGLMFIDLDHFKRVNDILGHDAGDQLLCSVAQRLTGCIRSSDTVSRYGGDEFAILLTQIDDFEDCEDIARKILNEFSLPHQIDGKDYTIGVSIGISIYPVDATSSQIMYEHADEAMYQAKESGRNQFRLFAGEAHEDNVKVASEDKS